MLIKNNLKCLLLITAITNTSLTMESAGLRSLKRAFMPKKQATPDDILKPAKKQVRFFFPDEEAEAPSYSPKTKQLEFNLSDFALGNPLRDEDMRKLAPHHSLSNTDIARQLGPLWDYETGIDMKKIQYTVLATTIMRHYPEPAKLPTEIARERIWHHLDDEF